MNELKAITLRHSVRQYLDKAIEEQKIVQIRSLIDECNQASDLHLQLVTDERDAFGSGMMRYGYFKNVSNYIVVAGLKGGHYDRLAGYYGERIVLALQMLGLNSCWVGLTFRNIKEAYTLREGEEVKAVIACGYGVSQGVAHPQKKGIEHYMQVHGAVPQWFRHGMEAALMAPTAINQQKFEFSLVGNNHVGLRKRLAFNSYGDIDLGIVRYHFEVGAGKENFEWETAL